MVTDPRALVDQARDLPLHLVDLLLDLGVGGVGVALEQARGAEAQVDLDKVPKGL